MKVKFFPRQTFEVIGIEESQTNDNKKFTLLTAYVYYQWFFPEMKRLSKVMKQVEPTLIYLWHDLYEDLPRFEIGDRIEGEIVKKYS